MDRGSETGSDLIATDDDNLVAWMLGPALDGTGMDAVFRPGDCIPVRILELARRPDHEPRMNLAAIGMKDDLITVGLKTFDVDTGCDIEAEDFGRLLEIGRVFRAAWVFALQREGG